MILAATYNFTSSVIELITILIIFVFVLALTYYVTRWIAGYQRTKTAQGNLAVVEVLRVSNNQYIQVLRAGIDKYLVVGVSKEQMVLLATLTEEELRRLPEKTENFEKSGNGFAEILEELRKKHGK